MERDVMQGISQKSRGMNESENISSYLSAKFLLDTEVM